MELLETQDPEKRKLLETSERHRRELEKEVSDISTRTEQVLTNALVVGGAMALTYFVVRQFSKRKSKKKKHKKHKAAPETNGTVDEVQAAYIPEPPTLISQIGDRLISHATLILVDLAREKLMEYLENRKKNEPS
jgi:hypothetical protein